jgi:ketosteroid isomerase-like protein
MSEENVEIVRRDLAARHAREWSRLAEIWDPEIELEVTAGAGTYQGIEQITRFFDSFSDLFSDYRVKVEEIIDTGDRVVTVERLSGRGLMGSDAGTWVHERLFRVISFKNGRIRRVKEYPSRAEALEAAGLRDEDGH